MGSRKSHSVTEIDKLAWGFQTSSLHKEVLCVCTFVCASSWVPGCLHVCTCMWRLKGNLRYHPQTHYPSPLREWLPLDWNAPIRIDWLIREPWGSSASAPTQFPSTGIVLRHHHSQHFFIVFVYTGQDGDQTQVPTLPRQMLYWLACANQLYKSTAEVKVPLFFSELTGWKCSFAQVWTHIAAKTPSGSASMKRTTYFTTSDQSPLNPYDLWLCRAKLATEASSMHDALLVFTFQRIWKLSENVKQSCKTRIDGDRQVLEETPQL
jgi:hypothetical protein